MSRISRTTAKPRWLRVPLGGGARWRKVRATLRALELRTVCEGASCPNAGECWSRGTATFLLMGDACTRGCRFCDVPCSAHPPPLDPGEPERVAAAVAALGLAHAVLTSVDRDDLADGGAAHFAEAIRRVKAVRRHPVESSCCGARWLPAPGRLLPPLLAIPTGVAALLGRRVPGSATPSSDSRRSTQPGGASGRPRVEALIPDFGGALEPLRAVCAAGPDVLGHNLETVRRLTPSVRDPRASYGASLGLLARVREEFPGVLTKSSLLLGLGESADEVREAMGDLREAGVESITLGQYLRPSPRQLPVAEWVPPERFEALGAEARALGFRFVASGPLVRSSYRAEAPFAENGGMRREP